jgi:hypothetical protein
MTPPVPVRIPSGTKPGAVVELYTADDGTLAADVRIPAPAKP